MHIAQSHIHLRLFLLTKRKAIPLFPDNITQFQKKKEEKNKIQLLYTCIFGYELANVIYNQL